jgi:flagellar hook-basal body complex protein FliE
MGDPFGIAISSVTSAQSSRITSPSVAGAEVKSGVNFADVLAGVARDGIDALHTAETVSASGLAGKAGVQEVVTGILAAERALQTAIAIRDKAISAIQEITRMQI